MTVSTEVMVAHHEAGHGCVAVALGLPTPALMLAPAGEGGLCIWGAVRPLDAAVEWAAFKILRSDAKPEPMPQTRVLEHLVMMMSGPVAGLRAAGLAYRRCDDFWWDLFDAGNTIMRALRLPYSRRVEEVLRIVELAAADRVHERWPEIQRVAAALVARRTLTGAEIQKVMGGEAI